MGQLSSGCADALDGVKLIVGDKCMGCWMLWARVFLRPNTSAARSFSTATFSPLYPRTKESKLCKMLKAIHAQGEQDGSREKAKAVVAELRAMKLKAAAKKVEDSIEETLTYCDFPVSTGRAIRPTT